MSGLPKYIRDGWRRNGPGLCICPRCGGVVPTNTLARASHRNSEPCRASAPVGTSVRDMNGTPIRVGDKVRRSMRGSDVIPVERRVLFGIVRGIGGVEHLAGLVLVSGFIAWESPTNFEKVAS